MMWSLMSCKNHKSLEECFAKFGGIWTSGSENLDENVKIQTDGQTTNNSLTSGELR